MAEALRRAGGRCVFDPVRWLPRLLSGTCLMAASVFGEYIPGGGGLCAAEPYRKPMSERPVFRGTFALRGKIASLRTRPPGEPRLVGRRWLRPHHHPRRCGRDGWRWGKAVSVCSAAWRATGAGTLNCVSSHGWRGGAFVAKPWAHGVIDRPSLCSLGRRPEVGLALSPSGLGDASWPPAAAPTAIGT